MTKKYNYNCLSYDIKNIIWLKVGEIKNKEIFKKKSYHYIRHIKQLVQKQIKHIESCFFYNKEFEELNFYNLLYFINQCIDINEFYILEYKKKRKTFTSKKINDYKLYFRTKFLNDKNMMKENKEEKIRYINNF